MQIYSVLIKIWKLQIDLLCIKKKNKYRMRPQIPCPCCGAPLALTSASADGHWTATLLCSPGRGCYHGCCRRISFMYASQKRKSLFFPEPHAASPELEPRCRDWRWSVESRFDELSEEEVLLSCPGVQLRVILKLKQPVSAAASDKVINADISS